MAFCWFLFKIYNYILLITIYTYINYCGLLFDKCT